jgi:hypothetical protein
MKVMEEEKKVQGGSADGGSPLGGFRMPNLPSSMSFAGPNGTSSVKF